jgi:VanZ family protein
MAIKLMLKVCSVVAAVVLVFIALAPQKFVPRSGLGWEIDHIVGYFVFTLLFCLAWPRPLVVGGALIAFAVLLEGLQAFPPDRSSNVLAAIYSACGVLAAAMLAELFIRARRRFQLKLADGKIRSLSPST